MLKCLTDKKNQKILRKELVKLQEELTDGTNLTEKEKNQ